MDLTLTLVSPDNDPEDIVIEVEPTHEVGELAAALSRYVGRRHTDHLAVLRAGRWQRLSFEDAIGDIGLISGDRLAIGEAPRASEPTSTASAVRLAVTSGPDAGRSFELGEGAHSVGRSTSAMVTLNDPLVSRQHFVLDVNATGTVELFPNADASNPPLIQGEPIDGHVTLRRGDVVQIGATRLRIREPLGVDRRPTGLFGRMPFHRTPYFRSPIPEQAIEELGTLPVKPTPRRFQFLAALSPLIMGVGMALMLGSMRYLMFAIFSPIMAAGSWWDQRRTGGREYDDKVEAFATDLADRDAAITAALATELASRLDNHPDIELLARRVDTRHNELWQRDRNAPDFLSLRIGVGQGPSKITVRAERRGDQEFLDQIEAVNARAAVMADVPIAVDLAELGTVGLVGRPAEIDDLATALIIQACCLHSPEDLVVAAAVAPDRNIAEWMKWLPHGAASSSPLAVPHLATSSEDADLLLRELAKVAEWRASSQDRQLDQRWPWLLVTIDRSLEPDASVISRLLDLGATVGISVIWLTDSSSRVPRQAEAQVVCTPLQSADLSEVRFIDPARPTIQVDPERVGSVMAGEIARALAPMRDATAANAVTSIPRMVPLFASLGVTSMTPQWITEQWMTDRGYSLTAPIGMTDTGPLELNLVEHGPHGLIGGTSGAGKSELVQSLVVNLAAHNSPDRINFLFVDYKGGALSEMFKDIPHTVGAVTNLDALLALRALTSLTAELDRRMELFKGRAPDIKEMIARYPDEAPPSLVIVVDEFAALVRELPEFVDGIVSIAERGRSLGIHLLMSTQRPSGAINDNIQQNTNLRIALRMLDSGESNNVIGAPDAAMIPGPLKGRGLARLGPGELIPFQSAWSGAPLLAAEGPPPISIAPFGEPTNSRIQRTPVRTGSAPVASDRTQLDATLEAIIEAAAELGLERGRAPWKEALPSRIDLGDVLNDPRSLAGDVWAKRVTIGMIDDPEAQDQYPAHLDLAEAGAAVIFGNSGSGKTTVLRTIAASAAWRDSQFGGGGLTIFGLDFASRQLGLLARFPQTSAIATGDDLEAITRILATIDDQLELRRSQIADATSRGAAAPEFSRILLLIDGYENFVQQFESASGRNLTVWVELVNTFIADGRQYGIDVAFTAGRRGAVRSALMSSITNRFILRQSDESGYAELGVPAKLARGLELEPGQGFDENNKMMRFAAVTGVPGAEPEVDEQAAVIAFAEALSGRVAPELVTHSLPVEVPVLDGADGELVVRVGLADRSLRPVDLDLTHEHVAVVGPPRSGKSTVLRTLATQLMGTNRQVWAVGSAGSPLAGLAGLEQAGFGRLSDILPVLEELAAAIESFPSIERVLIFDDADQFDDRSMTAAAEAIVEAGVRILGSCTGLRGYGSNPVYGELKTARSQIVLSPEGPRELQEIIGISADLRPGLAMPPGRGVVVADRVPTVLQCSTDAVPAFSHAVVAPASAPSLMPTTPSQGESPTITVAQLDTVDVRNAHVDPAVASTSDTTSGSVVIVMPSGEAVSLARPVIIGRRPGVDVGHESLRINDRYLSARHLSVEWHDGMVLVTDHGSRNGTSLRHPDGRVQAVQAGVPMVVAPGVEVVAGRQVFALRRMVEASVA